MPNQTGYIRSAFKNLKSEQLVNPIHRAFQIYQDFAELFMPSMCYFCKGYIEPWEHYLCQGCLKEIEYVKQPVCDICGTTINKLRPTSEKIICAACLKTQPPYNKARFAAIYKNQLKLAILDFKYKSGLYYSKPLGKIIGIGYDKYFGDQEHDMIIPIPIHPKRILARGFNQSVILGCELSKKTGVQMNRTAFVKKLDTPPQASLDHKKRLANLRGSFYVAKPHDIRGKSILLVDDVATTRATITEAARELSSATPTRINILTLALRSYPDNSNT